MVTWYFWKLEIRTWTCACQRHLSINTFIYIIVNTIVMDYIIRNKFDAFRFQNLLSLSNINIYIYCHTKQVFVTKCQIHTHLVELVSNTHLLCNMWTSIHMSERATQTKRPCSLTGYINKCIVSPRYLNSCKYKHKHQSKHLHKVTLSFVRGHRW